MFFALALLPLMCSIASQCSLDFNTWYLDDVIETGDTLEVSKALNIIQKKGGSRGMHLNIKKTEIFWPSTDPRSFQEGMFPTNIGR